MAWTVYIASRKWQAVMNVVINHWIAYNAGNFLTGWGSFSFLRMTVRHGVSLLNAFIFSLCRLDQTSLLFVLLYDVLWQWRPFILVSVHTLASVCCIVRIRIIVGIWFLKLHNFSWNFISAHYFLLFIIANMKFTYALAGMWHISFRPCRGPGVDSAPSENEYREHFLVVKAAGAWGWQPHHFHVPNVMKSGTLNLLETSGPHRACYGTPLPSCQYIWYQELFNF